MASVSCHNGIFKPDHQLVISTTNENDCNHRTYRENKNNAMAWEQEQEGEGERNRSKKSCTGISHQVAAVVSTLTGALASCTASGDPVMLFGSKTFWW